MNKVFRIIWNRALGRFDVVSELPKSSKKAKADSTIAVSGVNLSPSVFKLSSIATTLMLLLGGDYANAAEVTVSAFDPKDGRVEQTVTGNETLIGSFESIARGALGSETITLGTARDRGLIAVNPGLADKNILTLGTQTKTITYTDSITGNQRSISVYDNSRMSISPAANAKIGISVAVGADGQYVDRNMYNLGAGSQLDVNVGSTTGDWATNRANYVNAMMKGSVAGKTTSSVFNVVSSASDTQNAVLNYNSKTIANLGNFNNNIKDPNTLATSFLADNYTGTFNSVLGTRTVTTFDEFQAYNAELISAVTSGKVTLDSQSYATELAKAYDTNNTKVYLDSHIAADDAINNSVNRDQVSYIHGVGSHSIVNVNSTANIQGYYSDISLIRLNDGATLNNYGTIGSAASTPRGSYVVFSTDSTVNNSGVIDVGTSNELDAFIASSNSGSSVANGSQTGVMANGTSVISNTGLINVASRGSSAGTKGVQLSGTATLLNQGEINVAATAEQSNVQDSYYFNNGVQIQRLTTMDNQGTLYIGRKAKRTASDATEDLSIKMQSIGVLLTDGGTYQGRAGSNITIGSKTENATGIDVRGASSIVNQAGTMSINGNGATAGVASSENIGILSNLSAKNVTNSGTITLNGINSTAIKVLTNSSATNSGTINVNGGLDPISKIANYGIWSEGVGAKATLSGTVNLSGDGAIGVHSRSQGNINVTGNGAVKFQSGKNQTGYFIYGAGSTLTNTATGTQDVSTLASTLYRVDSGATFNGASASNSGLTASGENSTLIRVTGSGSSFDSGTLAMTVTGKGASGVNVEGGANGTITANTTLSLQGENSTAGIVDGKYYNLDGSENAAKVGVSELTSSATLTTGNTATGAYGYIARNGGVLNHKGVINFTQAGSTGVLVNGGTLNNQNNITVSGTAVNIQGANSVVSNSGNVKATDGTAAYLVGNNASLTLNGSGETLAGGTAHGVLLDTGAQSLTVNGATITMDNNGSGNAIENKANIAGIQLLNTRLNVGDGVGVRTGNSMAKSNSGTINVQGSGTGILFQNTDGSMTDKVLDMSDSAGLVINVDAAAGKGIVTNASSDLKTGASVNILDVAGGVALKVGGTTTKVEQSGVLTSKSTSSPVVDINSGNVSTFINSGTIQANSAAQQAVMVNTGSGVSFTNAANGKIIGQVNLLSGDNTVELVHTSQGTDFITGTGNDTFLLKDIDASDTGLFTSLNGGTGDDKLELDNSLYTITNANAIQNIDNIELKNNSMFTLDNLLLPLGNGKDDAQGTGYSIDETSSLAVKNNNAVAFNSHLSGSGRVTTDTNGNAFDFTANNATNNFSGTLALGNSTFSLKDNNTQALTNATLEMGANSITTVGDGVQTIGGLKFNGGTAVFASGTPGETVAKGSIYTNGNMDLTGNGTVQIDINEVNNNDPLPNTLVSILEQDDANVLLMLAQAGSRVTGSGGNLVLKDQNGNIITDGITADIEQNGTKVASGTYDYRLTSGPDDDGLYVNYGLTQVELLGQNTDALSLFANGKTGSAADLSAKVTGTGDLAIDTGTGQTVSLSNMDNNYSGKTDIRSGNLRMDNDNVLGQTSLLSLAANTSLDMNTHSQTIGELNGAAVSELNLNGGELTIANGGLSDGELTGSGQLNVAAGTLTVNGANAQFSATTRIASAAETVLNSVDGLGIGDIIDTGLLSLNGATGSLKNAISDSGTVALSNGSQVLLTGNNANFSGLFDVASGTELTASQSNNLGTAAIANQGSLVIDSATDWTLANTVNGSGTLTKNGSGTLSLTDSAAYTGNTEINAGGLQLGSDATPMTLASQQVNIADGAYLGGFGSVAGGVNNHGSMFVGSPNSADPTRFTVGQDLINNGRVYVGKDNGTTQAGNQLVVNGNYVGNNGNIHFNTVLGDDNSLTDSMLVNGNTSGTTNVSVNNAGGSGAKTLNGIELIEVKGQSDGEFTQAGRIVAGGYDYKLVRGTGDNAGNWYLTNIASDPTPTPGPDVIPTPDGNGTGVRPEYGSYTANLAAANTMFVTRLHDRLGETQYTDALTGEQKATSMWVRAVGGHNRSRDDSGSLKTQSDRYVVQLGGDIAQWSNNDLDRLHLGMMAGYGNSHSNTASRSGYGSDGQVDGYNLGLYATWFANQQDKTGLYVDSWAQYGWFNNSVKGEGLAEESYKSSGVTASIESGYTFKIGQKVNSDQNTDSYFIQPQAQIVWMGINADDHKEANGTRVSGEGDGNIMTRLGVRAYMQGHHASDDGKDRQFEPFIEANWIHNTNDFGATMNGVTISQAGTKNIAELKTGVEGQINKNLNVWGNVGQQMGDKGYSDTSVTFGVKVMF